MVMSAAEKYSREGRGGGRAGLPPKRGCSEEAALGRHLWAGTERSWPSACRHQEEGHLGLGTQECHPQVNLCSVDGGVQEARTAGHRLRSHRRALHTPWPDLDVIKWLHQKKKRKKHTCGKCVYEDLNGEGTHQMEPVVNSEESN